MNYGYLSLIPVVLTLFLVFYNRNVFAALFVGIAAGGFIVDYKEGTLFSGIETVANVFTNSWTTKSILFVLLTGAFVRVIEKSGGVSGFVHLLTEKQKIIRSRRGAEFSSFLIGLLLFIDGTTSIVISGVSTRHFFDKYDVSRRKLSYILDSTASPAAWLSPVTAAGAFLTALVGAQISKNVITGDPFSYVLRAVPFQIYSIVSIAIVGLTIISGRFPTKNPNVEKYVEKDSGDSSEFSGKGRAGNMVFPVAFLLTSIFAILFVSENGGTAIFTGILITLIVTGIIYKIQCIADMEKYLKWCGEGIASYIEITIILIMAFAFSDLLGRLGTGNYIAGLAGNINSCWLPALIFLFGAFTSFLTGTSGGTASILVPIAIPMAADLGADIPLVLGAAISGAVFGDHCSPVSDSTILASKVAEVDVMDHVATQMPFALMGGFLSLSLFLIFGCFI